MSAKHGDFAEPDMAGAAVFLGAAVLRTNGMTSME